MKKFEDTLQVCPLHRILETLDEPCFKCMAEMRAKREERVSKEKLQELSTSA